jgi:GNAT superfamily N-acetyltransferase
MRYREIIAEAEAVVIKGIERSNIPDIIKHVIQAFHGKGMSDLELKSFVMATTDWHLSKKLVANDHLVGFYLFREGSVIDLVGSCDTKEDLSPYAKKRGIEGIGLVVLPQFRGQGFGDRLKNLPSTMGYDYIFGMQLKSLNNLPQWLKRRRLVADCGGVWVTLADFH